MTWRFWALYLPPLAILFGLAILTGYLFEHGRSAWRRWRCRREMQKQRPAPFNYRTVDKWIMPPRDHDEIVFIAGKYSTTVPLTSKRRIELEALATARDKAERKIH